ncbi:MAG: DUF1549 domain-containing protein [Planctomycetota bacterium]
MTTFNRCIVGALLLAVTPSFPVQSADSLIDRALAQRHRTEKIEPASVCDDSTFLRRLTLDLMGRVPTVDELDDFLKHPDRPAAVERLLADPEHPQFWSQLWTMMLVGRTQQQRVETEVLRRWLEDQLTRGVPIDQVAFDLISAQGVTSIDGPVNYVVANRDDPVMRLSRTFLSVQLDCAECHDHPNDRWTNQDYVAMERFFEPLSLREVSGGIAVTDLGVGRREDVPVFLTGRKPQTAAWRRELAWMVVQSKPFSRAMVNRTWHWLMGRGLVDPVDGWTRENKGSAPQLLEDLAADFRHSDFQLRALIQRICLSDAYQRQPIQGDAKPTEKAESMRRLFAARTVRPLVPEQWLMSVAQVLDRPLPSPVELTEQSRRLLGLNPGSQSAGDPYDWTANTQTLIRQLSGDVPPPLRDLQAMYRATLARDPTSDERVLAERYSSQSILFALVHCNEFVMND